jgi:1-acyl-sn-glycerol-3-phosphate acyltransferase
VSGRSARGAASVVPAVVTWVSRVILRGLRVSHDTRGPTPRAGTLIVSNHLSWIDILVAVSLWRCSFVAKSEVSRWPIVGRIGDALGVIWIDRKRPRDLLRVIPLIEHTLRRGQSVLLFPEGTTSDGQAVLTFRSGLFEAAVRAGAVVTPVALVGSTRSDQPDALCWYGHETLLANLTRVIALRGASWLAHVAVPLDPSVGRKALAATSRNQIVRRFRPIRRQAESDRAKQNFRPIDNSEREILA